MTSRIEVISDVSFQSPSQVPLSEHDDMVQTFSANASDKAFRERILPWTSGRRSNIMVTPAGVVKVLDFGLAAYSSAREDEVSTVTTSPTRSGVILGTAAYMSPEQARGEPIDRRPVFGVHFSPPADRR